MLSAWSLFVPFIFGSVVGSFLNVLVWRLPRHESIVSPPSHCPKCEHRLGPLDLVPLLSILFLRARCRYCKAPFSWRYFVVELVTALLWAGLWLMFVVGVDIEPLPAHLATFLAYALFVSVLIPIFLIDIEHFVIPDELNAVLLIIGLLFAGLVPNAPTAWCFIDLGVVNFKNALIGAEIGVFFWAFVAIGGRLLFRKDALGHGDIKLARGIGALLMMPGALAVFMISVFIGVFAGVPFILWRSQKEPELAKNKWKQFVNWVVQLVSSKNKCKRFIDCVVQLISKKPPVESEEPSEPEEPPETIPSLLLHAIVYLFWLDLFVLFLPKRTQLKFYVTLSRVTGDLPPDFNFEEALAEATNPPDEKEDYKPTITTIPFGPSLVCGVLVVIYFGGTVVGWYKAYLAWAGLS